jgi:putative ABC transport system ATP-binding protein
LIPRISDDLNNAPGCPLIRASGLRFSYEGDGPGWRIELGGLEAGAGCIIRLAGPSGSGKTTLLRLLSGTLAPQAGQILWRPDEAGAVAVSNLPTAARADWRLRNLGLVFQDFALMEALTVEENAVLPARFAGLRGAALASASRRAREMAEELEMDRHWRSPVARLSQGERQRAALIRALALEPALVLADEPTSALDGHRRDLALGLLKSAAARGAAVLLVTHDDEAAAICSTSIPVNGALQSPFET